MNKNIKSIFFVLAVITLLATLGAVCAADDANYTIATDNSISDTTVTNTASNPVVQEPIQTASNDNKVDTKTIEKEEKQIKTATKTVEVNNYDEVLSTINNAFNDYENEEYIINLNEGTYQLTSSTNCYGNTNNIKTIIINGNNQTLAGDSKILRTNNTNITFKNITITHRLTNYVNANITFNQVLLNSTSTVTNYGCFKFENSTIYSGISGNGTIIISDDVIFGPNFTISNIENVIINDTNRLIPYSSKWEGDIVFENIDIGGTRTNNGNVTFRNSTIRGTLTNNGNLSLYNSILTYPATSNNLINNGNLMIYNSTINGYISNSGNITIGDDVVFGPNFGINKMENIIINNTERLKPFLSPYTGDNVFENIDIGGTRTNNGNVTIRNSTLSFNLQNRGNLTLENSVLTELSKITNYETINMTNCTYNGYIDNYGTIIIDDNIIFSQGAIIDNHGHLIVKNLSKTLPYLSEWRDTGIVEIENINNSFINRGNLTIENSTISTTLQPISNYGTLEFHNSTINTAITVYPSGVLIISDDTVLGENFKITFGRVYGSTSDGIVIINDTQRIADFLNTYTGNIILNNKTINSPKVNNGNLTLVNCTISSTISNLGIIYIEENTIFTSNGMITGDGIIVTDNITRLLPYISTINGNYTISDTTLNKSYTFGGNVSLNNCTITAPDSQNWGILSLNNCSVDVGEDNYFLDNYGTLYISEDTTIIGKIESTNGEVIQEEPHKTYVVNNRTAPQIFNTGYLSSMINPGDTLDFQGTISGIPNLDSIIINKPINIITTTNDGKIDNLTNITFTKEASGSNVTGLYTHNTQFYVINADHIIFNNISNVVEDKRVGQGVGQTSIRENSSYITVKNSYFYTKNNGGSSTLVLAYANYCTVDNNTINGEGTIGNLLYLTTYNTNIPAGATFNSHNKLINNYIGKPGDIIHADNNTEAEIAQGSSITYAICISGSDNLIENNTVNFAGPGIMSQWGSGVDGTESEESLFESGENIVRNNNLYGGSGIAAGDIIYNNYMEGALQITNATAYNNTARKLTVNGETSKIFNNTINGKTTVNPNTKNAKITNNILNGNINITQTATNNTITQNKITGTITLDGSTNTITDNTITTTENYTITTKKSPTNNIITDNYLIAQTLTGDKSVNLDKETNTIENNMPYENKLKIDTTEFTTGETTTITASIYYGSEVNTTISKGKVTFKVNGKTLKDTNGKVIYAKVVNGVATIENYEVPSDWTKEGTTIETIYSGSTQCEKLTSEKTNITVTPPEATLTITPITSDVQTGSTVTLKAKVATGDKTITTGKIVFKINGKTVKDANGKVIYAKVDANGEVSVDYTIPESFKAGTYNIEAVFTASGYEKLTDNTTMTVVKS